jgi:hypothetical protein
VKPVNDLENMLDKLDLHDYELDNVDQEADVEDLKEGTGWPAEAKLNSPAGWSSSLGYGRARDSCLMLMRLRRTRIRNWRIQGLVQ